MTRLTLPDGVQLNVETAGAGQPLVLLHGFTGCAANWKSHAAFFARYFSTVAIDLLGHGDSSSPTDPARYRMERCVEDLIAVFDQLGLGRLGLLGYSMGGRVALQLAVAHPRRVKALILESASPGLLDADERRERIASDEALVYHLEHLGLISFVDYWEKLPLFASQAYLPDSTRAMLRRQRLRNNPRGLANSLRGLGLGVQPPLWAELPKLQLPTLLIAGALDEKFTVLARVMAKLIPAAQVALIPQTGHNAHLEQPEVYDRLVGEWLVKISNS